MKTTLVRVSYSCKFNDPQKRYMNHNFAADAEALVEPGDDPEKIRQKLADDLEAFVHGRRKTLYRAAELENEFTEMKRNFGYAVGRVKDYEEGTRRAKEEMLKVNEMYVKMQSVSSDLAKLGVSVDLPKPFIDLPAAKPALAEQPADPEEEGNDPDEAVEEEND